MKDAKLSWLALSEHGVDVEDHVARACAKKELKRYGLAGQDMWSFRIAEAVRQAARRMQNVVSALVKQQIYRDKQALDRAKRRRGGWQQKPETHRERLVLAEWHEQ